jgi:hypothetical protein
MKRKTSNTERRIIRCIGEDRAKEVVPVYGAMRQTDSTPDVERPRKGHDAKDCFFISRDLLGMHSPGE